MGLRIVLVGQAAFGEQTLERVARRHEVVAVYCPPDGPGGKPDPLKAKAAQLGIPVHQPRSMKTDEVHATFAEYRADLAVLAYVTVIVPERIIASPRLGTICFHPSLLPRYRGGSAINWQIIRGEPLGGLSVFWTDAGIDTGPILLQKQVEIGPDDTAGSLYFEKIFPLGVDAMEEAVEAIAAGRAPRIPQDERLASYDPLCRDEHVAIDLAKPGRQVYALVRGADPQPGAYLSRHGERLRLYDCRFVDGGGSEPGTVLDVGPDGVEIAVAGGRIRSARVRAGASPKKIAAAEAGFVVGERLASGAAT
jgi:methionyl-tRNA formyltransferase